MPKFFEQLVQKAGNEFAHKVSEGLENVAQFVDTGSYALNALLSGTIYGGMPNNKVTALAGEESTGKSFYALSIARHFQEMYEDGAVICFESEGALDNSKQTTDLLKARSIDTERFFILPVITIQEFRTQAIKVLNDYLSTPESDRKPLLIILDSLGNVSTNKEVNDMAEGKDTRDMTRTQLIRGAFRAITLKLNRAKVPMIVTNHTYEVVGSYVPTKEMSGGGGLKYAASIITYLSKSKKKDTDNQVTGALISVKIDKSRFTREEKKIITLFDHTRGLDRYYGLLDIAEQGGVVEKISTKYKFPNGKSGFESVIYREPEKWFDKSVLDAIDVAAGKLFKYGEGENVPVDETEV